MHLIIGAGSVGTTLAAFLTKAGETVKLYVRPERYEAYKDSLEKQNRLIQLNYTYLKKIKTYPTPRITQKINLEGVKYIYICTKHYSLSEALSLIPESIPESISFIPCMNGVSASGVIKEKFPLNNILPITVMFNAKWLSPLNAEVTTKPNLFIPYSDFYLLEAFKRGGIKVKPGSESQEWGKLLINLNNSICTLTRTTFIDAFTNIHLRITLIAMLDEATLVLSEAGIEYRLPLPIPYKIFRFFLLHARILPWLINYLIPSSRNKAYPSMARDIDNNLKTEIDQINGEITTLGGQFNIPTPVNDKVINEIKILEKDKIKKYFTPAKLRTLVFS